MWEYGLDQAGSGQEEVAGTCECGNEPSGFINCGEFLDQQKTGQLLKKDSAQWSKYVVQICIGKRYKIKVESFGIKRTKRTPPLIDYYEPLTVYL